MDRNDEEFEAFLRRFQPVKPRTLPDRRRTFKALTTAAVLLIAIAVPLRLWRTAAPGTATTTSPASPATPATPAASIQPENAPDDGRPVETQTLDVPALPSRGRGGVRPGSPPLSERARTEGAAPRRLRVGDAIQAPVRIVNVNPVYPEEAQAAGIEGTVVLECVIGVDGSVIETRVLESIPELDQAAIDAVEQWHYQPTLLNGEAIELEMTVTISFTLR